jgi:hypothetical protein
MEAQVYDLETAIVHTRVRGQGACPRGRPVVAYWWLASPRARLSRDVAVGAEKLTDAIPGAGAGRRSR